MTKVKSTLKHMYGINEAKNSNLALKNKTNSVKIKELKKEKKKTAEVFVNSELRNDYWCCWCLYSCRRRKLKLENLQRLFL